MARRGKYPTPDEAVTNFTQGVEASADIWRTRTATGAEKYRRWFGEHFAPRLYPQIPSILALRDPYERSRRVGAIVKEAARAYRAAKLRAIITYAPAAPAPA
ncbi:MAG: hypothetical protein QXZ68_07695 [Candidatus Bathyarchaeia archaeon]